MHTFTDNAGREWRLEITIGTVRRVRDLLEVDLLALDQGDPPLLTRLELDLMLLVDVIYACLKPQADEADVTDEQFGEALGGDGVSAAHSAFWAALADFTQSAGQTHMAAAIRKLQALVTRATEEAVRRIDAKDVDQIVQEAMAGTPGDSSTSSPASSASAAPTSTD